jgi:hypothetical protein
MRMLLAVFLVATCVLMSGCAEDPGSMSQAEVEAKLKDILKLKTVTLTAAPEGGYAGTGEKEDGSTLKLTIAQKKDDRSLWYTAVDEQGELTAGGLKDFSMGGVDSGAAQRWSLIVKVGVVIALIVVAAGYYAISRKHRGGGKTASKEGPG